MKAVPPTTELVPMKPILFNLRNVTSPAFLWGMRKMIRLAALTPRSKDHLWRLSQKYLTFFDVYSHVPILNGMKMHVSSSPRVEQEIFLFGEWNHFSRGTSKIKKNPLGYF